MSIAHIDVAQGALPAPSGPNSGTIAFIGTATVLIRFGEFTILTDPNFLHAGDHAHLGYGMTSPRLTEPALDIAQLPPLDFVMLSHFHGDHFDQIAQERLEKTMPIVTTHHAARALERKGFTELRPLRTWESVEFAKDGNRARITAMPGLHAPGPMQAAFPPVMGEMLEIETATGVKVTLYVSGDTLMHDALHEIPRRYPSIDLGVFHLGGTRVLGLMVTMDAKQGADAVQLIDPQVAIPVHYDDYPVFRSPLADFKDEVDRRNLGAQVVYLDRGQHCRFQLEPSEAAARR